MAENGRRVGLCWSTSCAETLPHADVVCVATSAVGELVQPDMLAPRAVGCDLSRPANVSPRVREARPDVLVVDGGVVEVPGMPDLGWSFGLEPGHAYACMAETMMLALERRYEDASLGSELRDDALELMRRLAARHGFRLARVRGLADVYPRTARSHPIE